MTMKLYIKCMGMSRKDILEDLDNKSIELVRHLIKIVVYQDRGNLDHWSKELYGFLPSIPSLKGKNRFPDKRTILSGLWDRTQQRIHTMLTGMIKDYVYTPYDVSEDEVRDYVYRYLEWVAEELSTYGVMEGKIACASKAIELLDDYRFG